MLLLNFEPLSPAALASVAASDASVRKQLKSENFRENKAKNVMVPAAGPSPQFFNPPRDHYILGWYYARRRVYLQYTDPDATGNPLEHNALM